MANQVLAAQMIPRLGVPGLASPPPGRLPSHLDLLRLLHHQQHYNLVGFQGMGKICCKIEGKTHKARCQEGNDLMVPWNECRTGCYIMLCCIFQSLDERNCLEGTRSPSCSNLEVEFAAGSKNIFFLTPITLEPRVPHR